MPRKWPQKVGLLTQALPFLQRYHNKVVVIKYGGSAMIDDELAAAFASDVVLLKQSGVHPVIVHGGGPQIGALLERLGIKTEFIDGLRVTDKDTVEVVEMVLSGKINKSIVANIQAAGGYALGLSGKDCRLMQARKGVRKSKQSGEPVDLGFVGEPTKIDPLSDNRGHLCHRYYTCDCSIRLWRAWRDLQHQRRHCRWSVGLIPFGRAAGFAHRCCWSLG